MRQFVGLILAFILLPVILKVYPKVFKGKKAPLGPILILTGLIIALVGGLSFGTMGDSFVRVFTTFSTLQTLIVVVEIGVLGSILKHYGILERIVRALEQIVFIAVGDGRIIRDARADQQHLPLIAFQRPLF